MLQTDTATELIDLLICVYVKEIINYFYFTMDLQLAECDCGISQKPYVYEMTKKMYLTTKT